MDKQLIRDPYGKLLGSIETDSNGNKTVRDAYGKLLGYYNKALDVTRDFYGRIVARGDAASRLI